MKRLILYSSLIAFSLSLRAQVTALPENVSFDKGVYGLHLSPNGKWIGSMAPEVEIINLESGEKIPYEGCFFGLGNSLADNGVGVGDSGDNAAIFLGGEEPVFPKAFEKYWFSGLNAITPDASRIVGIVNTEEDDPIDYVPFVADIDASGEVVNMKILPYPLTDFFNQSPQYITAVWISDDGATVAGQVIDWTGDYTYPIVFSEDANAEWSYTLPSKSIFNPENLSIPDNPEVNEPETPEPVDFMNPFQRANYERAYEEYRNGSGDYPDPLNYMTPQEQQEYEAAVEYYENWLDNNLEAILKFKEVKKKILQTSPTFLLNDLTLHPLAESLMSIGTILDNNDQVQGKIYVFNLINGNISTLEGPESSLKPHQILPDGTMIATLPKTEIPSSYIVKAGTTEFIPIAEFVETDSPEIANWLKINFAEGSGEVSMSNDGSVLIGALLPDQLSDYDPETADFFYSTYVLQNMNLAGVEEILAKDPDEVIRVYNTQGLKILETKDAGQIYGLPEGIYIINGKKVIL